MVTIFFTLLVLTFASEDLACVAAGVLIARQGVPVPLAVGACALGIFIGDLGLWGVGRVLAGVADKTTRLRRVLEQERLHRSRSWIEEHAATAILISRFTPGTRVPLYVTAGLIRFSAVRFARWTLVAAALWTPAVVLASAHAGGAVPAGAGFASSIVVAAAVVVSLGRAARGVAAMGRRPAVVHRLARAVRWEFWPPWLFYAPVAIWALVLSIRHRGVTTITASNPGIADGGFVGESKFEILNRLPADSVIPSARVSIDDDDPFGTAVQIASARGWKWPLVAKPDVGQRGVGVCLVRTGQELRKYLEDRSKDVLLQPYHPGPFEAGIFYVRTPGQAKGRIWSITDKRFPIVTGDGHSTIRQLIDGHPRYRLQRKLFLDRHREAADQVLARDTRFQLAIAGNHAQGTSFYDGAHLWTAALEHRIDEIARQMPGFYIGRFDVRYTDPEAFKAGRDLAIVELNGAAAESTNIYDPGTPLLAAYRTLFAQWSLVFAIGAENRRRGVVPTPAGRFVKLLIAHVAG